MFTFPPTVILRHRKENLKKCTLRGLEGRSDFQFFTYPKETLPDLSGYFLLALDGPVLEEADRELGVFLIDGTWNYAEVMGRQLPKPHLFQKRSLPSLCSTAYPRRQEDCADPTKGLASVEALFLAFSILGRKTEGLLDHYYWRETFLQKNGLVVN
jgi:pre-rRNA-processing protein TSR3